MPTGSELRRMLKKAGCRKDSDGTNHEWWINPKTGQKFQVPRHKTQEVATGTLKQILKSAGLK